MTLFDKEGTGTFDFRPIRIPMDQDRLPQRATLSVYRLPWCDQFCFWLDVKAGREVYFDHLIQGFQRTGGAPKTLLVRPTRPFATPQKPDIWQRTFRRFCQHYGCDRYPWRRHFTRGVPWLSRLQDTVADTEWSTVELCQAALDRLATELSNGASDTRDELLTLPAQPFCSHQDTPCRAASDGFLRYEHDFYSVPSYCAGATIWVRRTGTLLRFYNEDERLVTQHSVGPGNGTVRLRLDHFRFPSSEQDRLVQAWRVCFPEDELFLSLLLAQRKLAAAQTLRAILNLTHQVGQGPAPSHLPPVSAVQQLLTRFILGLLEGYQPEPPDPLPPTSRQQLLF